MDDDEQEQPPSDGSPPKRAKIAADNVACRVANWVVRLGAAEATVLCTAGALINVTNTVYANVAHRAAVELPIAVERERITELETVVCEQHNRITDLKQQVAALTTTQQRVTELERMVSDLQQKMAPGKRGRPKKAVTEFTAFMTHMVMEMMASGGAASSKTTNPVEQYAQHIATLVVEQQTE